jgi:hypothetical protein
MITSTRNKVLAEYCGRNTKGNNLRPGYEETYESRGTTHKSNNMLCTDNTLHS